MVNDVIEIKRALISVYDKSRLEEMLKLLAPNARNIELISSGGTAKKIAELGYKVTEVSTYTGYPESPDGLVKTLQPKIHGGLLMDPSKPAHAAYMDAIKFPEKVLSTLDALSQLKQPELDALRAVYSELKAYAALTKIGPIDLFVGNLYPFQQAVVQEKKNYEKINEMIDIGGPAMIRASAKNAKRLAVLVNWSDLDLIREIDSAEPVPPIGTSMRSRMRLKQHAFRHTREYEGAIDDFWSRQDPDEMAEYFLKENK